MCTGSPDPTKALLGDIARALDVVAVEHPCLDVVPLLSSAGWTPGGCIDTIRQQAVLGFARAGDDPLSGCSCWLSATQESVGCAERICTLTDIQTLISTKQSLPEAERLLDTINKQRPQALQPVALSVLPDAESPPAGQSSSFILSQAPVTQHAFSPHLRYTQPSLGS